jgi:hypothetical protein
MSWGSRFWGIPVATLGVDPAVTALRLQAASGGQPATMASPPTITQSSAWFTANTLYDWFHAGLRRLDGDWAQADTTYPRQFSGAPASITYNLGAGNWGCGGPQGAVEFICADSFFEFGALGAGSARYRVYVNGEIGGETADLANSGSEIYFKVDFGSAASRTIRIEEVRGRAIFRGMRAATAPIATSAPSSKLVIFGDSFTEGTGAATRVQGLSHMIARELGFRDYLLSGSGGTGWVNPGTGRTNGFDRWTADVVARNPTMLICLLGINDTNQSYEATIQSTLPTKMAELRAAMPNCLVHVFGCFNPSYPGALTGGAAMDAALQAGVSGLSRTWFHSLSDIGFTKADSTHPDTAGHTTLYKAIYNKIASTHGLRTVI